ncbi:UNVERIFIED_CONTAM: hypothetical protein FKN15_055413 [Acipenser sinensis]
MAEEYFHINKKTKMDFDEDENTDDSDNYTDCLRSDDTDCLVSDSDRDSDTIEEDKIILIIEKIEKDAELKNVCARAELTVGRLRAFVDMFQMTRLKE